MLCVASEDSIWTAGRGVVGGRSVTNLEGFVRTSQILEGWCLPGLYFAVEVALVVITSNEGVPARRLAAYAPPDIWRRIAMQIVIADSSTVPLYPARIELVALATGQGGSLKLVSRQAGRVRSASSATSSMGTCGP
jgi:hypothetical protein